ncbi:hypothetical protein P168DRAFT_301724 [Aspergillus campestris IBT 28561]|uniref:Ubiquitin-like domain-containing protein n=1 Tax=Aspergillus campestris (strain IBT 28561) TaxID=1392248 RepID=A0A2I1DH12_ASPC2|nr:uncharacterized protein P168DRAFT_301724 [Aspergillus campestris IBT 28561]PKY09161.1 hypothetical protein P168DRAFT_301724 [Aspergillus campestris IBT 28561]
MPSMVEPTANPPLAAGDPGTDNPLGFTLHVLCPSLPPPGRFSFNNLAASTSIAELKRLIQAKIPGNPVPESQRLIYSGRPVVDIGLTLQSILEPEEGSQHSIHLVLPPAPPPNPLAATGTESLIPNGTSSAPQTTALPGRSPQFEQGLRLRGQQAPLTVNEAELGHALRRNIEIIREQLNAREGARPRPTHLSRELASPVAPGPWHQWHPQSLSAANASNMPRLVISGTHAQRAEQVNRVLTTVRPRIEQMEAEFGEGLIPSLEMTIAARTQLLECLDEQTQNPLMPRNGEIERLLDRLSIIYRRADTLRLSRGSGPTATNVAERSHERAPVYLLTSPDGYQALVASPETQIIPTSMAALRAGQIPQPTPTTAPLPNVPTANPDPNPNPANLNPNAMVMENAVRQALINQRAGNNDQMGMARYVRRMWLFIRLYFFCYMLSEPGTWTRAIYVATAIMIALLSDTTIPQQVYRTLVTPLQEHLEGLAHPLENEHPPNTHAAGAPNAENRVTRIAGVSLADFFSGVRRFERSAALFLASLVPGVGERQVAVRQAAEAARNEERLRAEEDARRQEAESNREQEPGQEQDGGSQPAPEAESHPPGNGPNDHPPVEAARAEPHAHNE